MVEVQEEIRPGYRLTKVGWIPEDWHLLSFEDIAHIDRESLSGKTDPEYTFNYISLSDVNSDNFSIETNELKFKNAPSRARRIVKEGDVLMSTVRPNLQGFSIIRNNGKGLVASTGFAILTSKEKFNSEYIYHYLFSSGISRQLHWLLVGSNYPAINSSDVRKLKIAIPNKNEQKAIAQVLSTWDKAIENLTHLITEKQQKKKALMRQLLTGKKRFPEFVKLEGYKETKIGMVPKDWEVHKAKDLFKSVSIKNNGDEELLAVTQDRGAIPRSMLEGRVMSPDGSTSGYKLVVPGNFIISLRSFQGGLEYSEYQGLVSPAYTILQEKVNLTNLTLNTFSKVLNSFRG